jgi:hypothetical protein
VVWVLGDHSNDSFWALWDTSLEVGSGGAAVVFVFEIAGDARGGVDYFYGADLDKAILGVGGISGRLGMERGVRGISRRVW